MPTIRLGLIAALAIPLVACSQNSPLESDLDLLGTEPFWAVQISKEEQTTTISRPGEGERTVGYPVETRGEGGAVVLTAPSPGGDIVMTLTPQECSDGMSDREYPWSAVVVIEGTTLTGCAGPSERQTPA
jgi:uncharacterized membrane protein